MANTVVLSGRMTKLSRQGTTVHGFWFMGGLTIPGARKPGTPLFTFFASGEAATIAAKCWEPGRVATIQGSLRPESFETAEGRKFAYTLVAHSVEVIGDKQALPDIEIPKVEFSPPTETRRVRTREEIAKKMPGVFQKKKAPKLPPDDGIMTLE